VTDESKERGVTVGARISPEERKALELLAREHDRTASREVRRAIRFYISHFELADRALRERVGTG